MPLAVAAAFEFGSARSLITAQAEEILGARADRLVAELDGFHSVHGVTALRMASLPAVGAFCRSTSRTPAEQREITELLATIPSSDPSVRGVAVFDPRGVITATTEGALLGEDYGLRSYVQAAADGAANISDIYVAVPEVGSVPTIAYAAPVLGPAKEVLGVVTIFVRAQALWSMVRAVDGRAGAGSFAVIYDPIGIRVAHSADAAQVFRPAATLDPATAEALISERRFGAPTRQLLDLPMLAPQEYRRALDPGAKDTFRAAAHATSETWCAVVTRKLGTTPWTVFFFAPEESLAAPVKSLVEHTLMASAVIMALALLVGFSVSRRVARPIQALLDASEAVRAGDLEARVVLDRKDEFGELGESFNSLAAMTLDARQDLEKKIGQRTEALERARAELEGKVVERTAALEKVVSESERQNRVLQERGEELSKREVREQAYGRAVVALAGDGALELVLETALREARAVGASIMVCFRITRDRELVPIAGVASTLTRDTVIGLTGFSAEALATRKLVLVDPVPEDVELRFDAALAGWRPKSIALVPLFVGEREVGLVAVGALATLGAHALGLFTDLALPLALTILRHDLHEETRRFSDELECRNVELRDRGAELRAQGVELEAQRAELEAKNLEIVRASQLKTDFLANMSHELRTPLNAVIGFSDLVLEEAREKLGPKHAKYVQDILSSGRHLLHLINDILDLVKIEAGKVTLARRAILPGVAIQDAITFVAPAAKKKRITIKTDVRSSRSAHADPDKLRQILLNLASNAVKFGPEGSSITVGAEDEREHVRFWVRDHGPGIDKELLQRLFQPFVQGESSLVKVHEGTGLGLAIAKRLVEQHGGQIETTTPADGGTVFAFTIPVAEAGQPSGVGDSNQSIDVRLAETSGTIVHAPRPTQADHRVRPLALVVEDSPASANLLRSWLTDAGYDVAEARTVRTALDQVEQLRPSVVLLDLVLEGEDGFRVLQELKARPDTKDIPIVITSGQDEQRRGVALGAIAYFTKPIDRPGLMKRLATIVRPGARQDSTPLVRVAEGPVPSLAAQGPKILVVDDNDLNRELVRDLLERKGYRVLLAQDGVAAVEVTRRERPALVLMDLAMPKMDGFTAVRALKADPATRDIPVVALTAMAMRSDEERVQAAGFNGYLTKPIERLTLEQAVTVFLTA